MARKIKFALKMADGADVRTIDELKEHFDVESVVGYFTDGRLLNWLQVRYYDDEADKVQRLKPNDPQLHKKLCAIFGVKSEVEELDLEEISRRHERLNKLKQYTADENILAHVDQVAFDQEDLGDLLDEDATLIYLCNNRFTIPLRVTDKTYIGVGKAIAVIRSNKLVDFDALNIKFKGMRFDDNYDALLKAQELAEENKIAAAKAALPKNLYDAGKAAFNAGNYETALEKYKQAAELDFSEAFSSIGHLYLYGYGVDKNLNEARRWFKLGMDEGDDSAFIWYLFTFKSDNDLYIVSTEKNRREAFNLVKHIAESDAKNTAAIIGLAYCYENGIGIAQNTEKAFDFYKQAANAGNAFAMCMVAVKFQFGNGVRKDLRKAIEWYKKAADIGYENAYFCLGEIYLDKKDNQKAGTYFRKGADTGDVGCMFKLAEMCEHGLGMVKNEQLAFQWYLRAAEAGDVTGMTAVGHCYMGGYGGTTQNLREAERWFKQAADTGDPEGLTGYGDYLLEHGSKSDAAWYYQKAVEGGYGEAAFKLGKMYRDGNGVNKSSSNAQRYFNAAENLGYEVPSDEKSSGCFITTAVCENFGKDDDCYELTAFRNFRDGWLTAQPDGKALIAEYYAIAPAIVDRINRLPDAAQIYETLRTKYLAPCLNFIERGDNTACKRLYVEMVTSLKKKFLGGC